MSAIVDGSGKSVEYEVGSCLVVDKTGTAAGFSFCLADDERAAELKERGIDVQFVIWPHFDSKVLAPPSGGAALELFNSQSITLEYVDEEKKVVHLTENDGSGPYEVWVLTDRVCQGVLGGKSSDGVVYYRNDPAKVSEMLEKFEEHHPGLELHAALLNCHGVAVAAFSDEGLCLFWAKPGEETLQQVEYGDSSIDGLDKPLGMATEAELLAAANNTTKVPGRRFLLELISTDRTLGFYLNEFIADEDKMAYTINNEPAVRLK